MGLKVSHAVATIVLLILATVLKAEPLPGERDLARDRQQRLLQEQRQRLNELQNLSGTLSPVITDDAIADGHCVDIQNVNLLGASRIKPQEQVALVQPYEQQCLNTDQLNQLLQKITDFYLERGYLTTRAYLPAQDLSDGNLQIQVIEGRVEGLDGAELLSPQELQMCRWASCLIFAT